MFSAKKIIITSVILSLIAGTAVFADKIAQVTGLQEVEASQNDSVQNQQEGSEGGDEGRVTSEPIESPTAGVEVTISEDGVVAKATGLENALQHVKNENARAHIKENIEKQNAKKQNQDNDDEDDDQDDDQDKKEKNKSKDKED